MKTKSIILPALVFLLLTAFRGYADSINSQTLGTGTPRQYEKSEWDITLTASFSDPFNYLDIALEMILTSPSGKSLILPCYYVSGASGSASSWKARFAPREVGTYTYYFKINRNGAQSAATGNATFSSQAAFAGKNGFLHKNNNWTFKFDSGSLFRGMGENMCWEARSFEDQKYTFEYWLPLLQNSGANFYRTWMCSWSLPLEWKDVNNTNFYADSPNHFNPSAISRMDWLVAQNEARGLYMMLTLDNHNSLIYGSDWERNNYNTAKGGPASSPADFFVNTNAKNQVRSKLRYLIARWGYSPSIAAWEFFNEIDNAYGDGPSFDPNTAASWHGEMATYLKSVDPYQHLVTTSISHRDNGTFAASTNALFNNADIDFSQRHIYSNGANYVNQIPSLINTWNGRYGKPFVMGEYGYDSNGPSNTPESDFDFKRGLWYGLFSPTPILPMAWWWETNDSRGLTGYINSVKTIHSQMMTAGNGSYVQISATTNVGGVEAYAVRCGTTNYVYLLNTNGSAVNANVTVGTSQNGTFGVQSYYPGDGSTTNRGNFTASNNSITITGNALGAKSERVLILAAGGSPVNQTPYGGTARSIPGTIQAEDYDNGGEGVAYHDADAGNSKGAYRRRRPRAGARSRG